MPVTILQLLNYTEESGPFQVYGLVVGLLKIMGQVLDELYQAVPVL